MRYETRSLSTFLKNNLLLLEDKCQRICEQDDIDSVETYTSMFADLADWELQSISDGENLQNPGNMLAFLWFWG